jgi:hypothetical protein
LPFRSDNFIVFPSSVVIVALSSSPGRGVGADCAGVVGWPVLRGGVVAADVAGVGDADTLLPSREPSVGLQLEDKATASSENTSAADASRAPVQIFFSGARAGCSEVMRK